MTQVIGPALFAICLHWLIRWAIRAELERVGFQPLPPRALTAEEWEQVDALARIGKTNKADSLYQKLSRAVRA